MKLLIKNGIVIDPKNGREGEFDLLVEDGLVKDVQDRGAFSEMSVDEELDVGGKWVVPGLIDLHVHLREPGFEWKATVGTEAVAAVQGGYTSICCMPNTQPVNDDEEVTRYILDRAKMANAAKVLPIGAVSVGSKGEKLAPLSELRKAGCVAFSDDGEPIHDAGVMRRALEWCLMLDATISCHEEDKCLSCGGVMNESPLSQQLGLKGVPTVAEDVMVARDIELARYTGGKVHICHISSARGVELVRRAKDDGIRITCEVTPHHLLLTEEYVVGYDAYYKMSPPLRDQETVNALIEGIKDGTIDAIASDHAPHEDDSKKIEFDKAAIGLLGLQTSLPLTLEFVKAGVLSKTRAVELLSTVPAQCFGMDSGHLSKGAAADICVIDPEHKWVFDEEKLLSKSCNSPFIGRDMTGIADTVLVDGRIVVRDREVCIG